ncbi:MAG: hypothetical protein JWN44_3143 [Myxococcales bacterium]|nr:hypothetical protein [Myxococcales bacterium]
MSGVSGAKTILLVEDDQAIRETMAALLVDEGFAVEQAKNGAEGLERLRARPETSLVLLDLWMPVMNGWQMLEAIFADAQLRAIPIVVISAAGDLPPPAGAAAYLRKPVRLDALLEAIENHCRR